MICVGTLKEEYLKAGIKEYLKRLHAFAKVEIVEIEEEPAKKNPSVGEIARILDSEAQRILKAFKTGSHLIALDIEGDQMTSESFAEMIEDIGKYASSNLVFVIGGSWGLADAIKNKCSRRVSFSRMTFPHQLMRLIFIEQLYRAFTITNNHNYHK